MQQYKVLLMFEIEKAYQVGSDRLFLKKKRGKGDQRER